MRGGESGVRTHGRLLTFAGFQDRCLKPTRPSLHGLTICGFCADTPAHSTNYWSDCQRIHEAHHPARGRVSRALHSTDRRRLFTTRPGRHISRTKFLFPKIQIDSAVGDFDDAVGFFCDSAVMGDDDEGGTEFVVDVAKEVVDGFGCRGVEVSGWLVGEDHGGIVEEGAGDCGALLLAAGHLGRVVVHHFFEPDQGHEFAGAREDFGADGGVADAVGHEDVFERGEFGEKIVELENEADAFVAVEGELSGGHFRGVDTVYDDGAGGGGVERTHDVHEGAFAAAGLADDRVETPLFKGEIDIGEHLCADGGAVYFVDALEFKDVSHSCALLSYCE